MRRLDEATASAAAPRPAALQLTRDLTVELWVRPDRLKDRLDIVGTDSDHDGALFCDTGSDIGSAEVGRAVKTQLYFFCGDNGAGSTKLRAEVTLTIGAWVHLAVTRQVSVDGWISLALYVNGEPVAAQERIKQATLKSNYPWAIPGNTGYRMPGAFADWRLWNVARTAAQVKDNFQRRLSGTESGLVGYWRLDESGTPTAAAHATDPALNLTLTGFVADSEGPVGASSAAASTVEGVSESVTVAPPSPRPRHAALALPKGATVLLGGKSHLPGIPTLPSQTTVECWLRLDSARAEGLLWVLPGEYVYVDSSRRMWMNGSGAGATPALPADTWVHVALARDTAAGQVTWTVFDPRSGGLSTGTVAAGSWLRDPSPCLAGVGGQLAELRIWSGLRGAEQLAATRLSLPTTARQGLLAWWPCDEGDGGVLYDRAGSAHGAAAGVSWTTLPEALGVQPSGFSSATPNTSPAADPPRVWPVFAGDGGFLLPAVDALATARSFTVELWLRPTTTLPRKTARIFEMVSSATLGNGVLITHYVNPYRHFASISGSTTLAELRLPYDAAWPGGTGWTHVALVRSLGADGAGELRVYQNGQLARSSAFTTTGDGATPRLPIKLGVDFEGAMAELRVWAVARSQAEIQATMRRRLTRGDGLVGCWPLDDGGPTARALVGTGGVCLGASWETSRQDAPPPWGVTTAGGYLLTFDADTKITIPDHEVLHRLGGLYTVECWIKATTLEGVVLRKGVTTAVRQELALGVSSTGRLGFYYGRQDNDMTYTYATGVLADRWHHVAVVYNIPGNRITLVIDGVETQRGPANYAVRDGDYSSAPLEIGVRFQGQICDVRLWRGDQLTQLSARRVQRVTGPMEDLLGSWPLDDGPNSAGVIADLSGNNLHGVLQGGRWSAGKTPWPGLQLSGAQGSYARAPTAASLALVGTMTLELWVRPDELVDDKVILGTDSNGEGELTLSTPSAQSTRLLGETRSCSLIYRFGGTGAGRQLLSAAVDFKVGTWTHLAVVRETAADNTHTVRLYKDGVSVLEQRTPAVVVAASGSRWAIGGNSGSPLAAAFADLRLWSSARTAAELVAKMRVRLTGQEPSLIGYWRLDESGAPTALAHATNATLSMEASGVRAITDGPGAAVLVEPVPALRFDGDTKLVLGRPAAHPWRDTYTMEMWVRPSSEIVRGGFLVFQYGTDQPCISVGGDGTFSGLARSSPGALPDDRWSHVAIVVDRTGTTRSAPTLYVNGVVVASAPAPAPAATSIAPTVIGCQPWSNWGASFIGDIAEIRLWSRALGAAEIRDVLQRRPTASAPGLVGFWTFPADSGQVVPDLSPYGNHAVLLRRAATRASGPALIAASLPTPTLLRGPSATRAVRLDGLATTELRVPDHATNRLTGDLTVEAWLRVRGDFRTGTLYGKSETVEGTLYLMADPTERSFRYYGEGNTVAGPNVNFCPAELVPGEWHHLAFVRDTARRELRYYINGALVQIDVNCNAMIGATSTGPATLGTKVLGDLAELRVWSVARDEANIRRDLGRRLTSASGLVARWALDDASGTVAKNSTEAGAAIDAALVGGVTWITDGPALT